MALDIKSYNDTFKAFADFAKVSEAKGNKSAIARIAKGVDVASGPLAGRNIVASSSDSVRGFFKWFRSTDDKKANDDVRSIFKKAVADMFGGESKIPESVKKAMELDNYGKGKPLTARRIRIVKNAIDAIVPNAIANMKQTLANDADRADRIPSIEKLVAKANGDPDMIALLQGDGCSVACGIISDSNGRLRSEEDQARRFEALKDNLDELRQATKGNTAAFNAALKQLELFGGKALQQGMITKIFEATEKADIGAIANVPPNASPAQVAEVFCSLEKIVNNVCKETKVLESFGRGAGANEKGAAESLVMGMLLSRCDRKSLQKLQMALFSPSATKLMNVCMDFIGGEDLPGGVRTEMRKRPKHVVAATGKFASCLTGAAPFRQSVLGAVLDALGMKMPKIPNAKWPTDSEILDIYNTLEKHVVAEHQDIVQMEAEAANKKPVFVDLG